MAYGWIVAAAVSLGVLSFGLWVHHMFTTGIPHMGLAFFSAASTLVAVPTAVQIFAWIGTLWQGRPAMHLPMLWLMAFFATFVIGGLTGVMVAIVPFDWQAHDTYFIVAHLHYVLVGGFVFPMLAALYYWMPHFAGRTTYFKLGPTAFWLIVPGFHGTFLLLHWAGLLGMRRRIDTYEAGQGWEVINLIASVSSFVMAIGFVLVLIDVVVNAFVAVRGARDPWNAGTLEWAYQNWCSLSVMWWRDGDMRTGTTEKDNPPSFNRISGLAVRPTAQVRASGARKQGFANGFVPPEVKSVPVMDDGACHYLGLGCDLRVCL